MWARSSSRKEGIAQANLFFLQPPALHVHFLWMYDTAFPKPSVHKKMNNSLYLQWKSHVRVSVMVQDHIVGHVKAFSDPQMVKEWRLSGNIAHVHHGNIWNEQGKDTVWEREAIGLLNLLPADHWWGTTAVCVSTNSLLGKAESDECLA